MCFLSWLLLLLLLLSPVLIRASAGGKAADKANIKLTPARIATFSLKLAIRAIHSSSHTHTLDYVSRCVDLAIDITYVVSYSAFSV